MQSVLFGIFVAAILVVIHWYIQNERKDSNPEGDKGWLAMRQPGTTTNKIRPTTQATAGPRERL